ncbi:DEAD/DEAH box helicase [Candidatus Sumerlaeota bacterium]|nr:DEAD/DEAH box helicase [Candidatus Sumerlaeota bacterium]
MAEEKSESRVQQTLAALRASPGIRKNIVHWHKIEPRPARYAPFPDSIPAELTSALKQRGFEQLYTHQAQAINHALNGRHVVIVTPTASGKTLCYNAPVLKSILDDPQSRALYLFPTKALSQDQMNECHELSAALGRDIKVYTYDGDTPANARRAIRTAGHIVVTNPDMLHTGILPHHTNWIKLFENLKYVVIDEIHHYRGVFGAHLVNVVRRLRRIAKFYGANPVFICCSATIANPAELAREVVGEDCELVDDNGAPQGEKAFLFYNPPVVNAELGIRRSVLSETRRLASRFLSKGIQTIVFARSRLRVEILTTYLKRSAVRLRIDPERVKGYRGGYLPLERRAIEQGVRDGSILGVVSTNALELGIDIGRLQAAILAGYPGNIASTWQQGGRAGRSAGASVVILIASSSPLDQFMMNHPEYFFGASPEAAVVNPDNLAILASHVKCATFELPFEDGEAFGDVNPEPLLNYLEREEIVRHAAGRWYWSNEAFPAEGVSLRTPGVENFVIIDVTQAGQQRTLGEVDYDSAPMLIHEDAIYMHQSRPYFVERLDWDGRTAYVRQVKVDYYTDAQSKSEIRVIEVDEHEKFAVPDVAQPGGTDRTDNVAQPPSAVTSDAQLLAALCNPGIARNFGDVSVQTVVAKYKKIKFETHENVGWGDVHLPQSEIQTEAYWITFRPELKQILSQAGLDMGAGLNALAHAVNNAVPVFALCDPRDIFTVPMVRAPFDQLPTLYVYDRYPGGIGLSRRVYSIDVDVFQAARRMIADCPCSEGCPSCTGPALETGSTGKRTAALLLDQLLEQIADPTLQHHTASDE